MVSPANINASTIILDDPRELRHLRKVLRLTVGDRLICIDGTGAEYRGTITALKIHACLVRVDQRTDRLKTTQRLWLGAAIPKADRFDWLVQKATELGVGRVTPLLTERTVVRLNADQAQRKQVRWQRIVREAAKQCGQTALPTVDVPQRLRELLPSLERLPLVLIPTLAVAGTPLREVLQRAASGIAEVAVLIGPEGDFSHREVQQAVAAGAVPVSLGRLTLRSETAAIAVLAIVAYETER